MNAEDRKLLDGMNNKLGALDERTVNTYKLTEKIEQHMTLQNGKIEDLDERVIRVEEQTISNLRTISRQWKIIGGGLAAIGGIIAGISKVVGNW